MSQGLLKLTSTESARPSNHLVLCRPLLLLPSIFPSIGVFSNESALHIRWPCGGATSHCRAGPGTRVAGCSVPADWKAGEPPALIGWGEALVSPSVLVVDRAPHRRPPTPMPQGAPEGLETLQDQQEGLTQAVFTFPPLHWVLEHVRYFVSPSRVRILFPQPCGSPTRRPC